MRNSFRCILVFALLTLLVGLSSCKTLGADVSGAAAPPVVEAPALATTAKLDVPPVPVMPPDPVGRQEADIWKEADKRGEVIRSKVEKDIAAVVPGPYPEPKKKKAPEKPVEKTPAPVPAVAAAPAAPVPVPQQAPAPVVAQAKTIAEQVAPKAEPSEKSERSSIGASPVGIPELRLVEKFNVQNGLPSNLVTTIYVDDTEAWVGTSGGGVARYLFSEKNWLVTSSANGLLSDHITDVIKFKGSVYVGTKQGISIWDGFSWAQLTEKDQIQLFNVSFRVNEGKLWISARNMRGGLLSFDGEKWANKSTLRQGVILNNISDFDFSGKDIWIGTTSRGVYAQKLKDWQVYSVTEGIASNFVYTMAVKEGKCYLGGCCGVSYFDGNSWKVYDVPEGLPHSTVNKIVWDGDVVWMGSKNGLGMFDGEEFRNYYVEDGLLSDNHVTSLFSNKDELWVGTVGGLTRLAKSY